MEKGSGITRAEMYQSVFGTETGKWVLADMLKDAGVGEKLFAQEQFHQNMNVATHDFAIGIKELATPNKEQ